MKISQLIMAHSRISNFTGESIACYNIDSSKTNLFDSLLITANCALFNKTELIPKIVCLLHEMRRMGRISLHKHTHINARRRRYAHLQGSQPISSLLDNQLFHTKAGVAYLFSIIGCMAYNYLLVSSR
ncbi:hypothetical protein RB195_025604 [Necator americanus]|uniref:Uncharacterized protein n=1 Tax=Necator americanus TaxID=51031 RepID=A0ABR1ET24_NECAM